MKLDFGTYASTRATNQSQRIFGSTQVPNSAGGYAWPVDDWMRLDRFLVLGTEDGSYYATERQLTVDSAEATRRCIAGDGVRVVDRVVDISRSGRAAKNDPAIFVLAMCAKLGDTATRKAAYAAVSAVCRTGTHLMHFAAFARAFGGWGRGMRNAIARWYTAKSPRRLAYQLVKYQARDGWSNRDLLRLAHPKAPSSAHEALFSWVVGGSYPTADVANDQLDPVAAFEATVRAQSVAEVVRLIEAHHVPREAVPSQWLSHAAVWEALLASMPMTAMIRNLATMTRVGLCTPGSAATTTVARRLGDVHRLRKARVHPIALLAALLTYREGRGARGQHTWTPVARIVDALDAAFYQSFAAVEPSGARTLLALDVSGSMTCGRIAGVPGLSPRVASAAMALVTAATEPHHGFVAFTGSLRELAISPRQRLDDVLQHVDGLPFGGTDCAQPMLWARERNLDVDTFVVYTDSETWAGHVHPAQALRTYRESTGIPAKLIVVGMVSNGFSIADPNDAGMLDIVGFDTAAPSVIGDFARVETR